MQWDGFRWEEGWEEDFLCFAGQLVVHPILRVLCFNRRPEQVSSAMVPLSPGFSCSVAFVALKILTRSHWNAEWVTNCWAMVTGGGSKGKGKQCSGGWVGLFFGLGWGVGVGGGGGGGGFREVRRRVLEAWGQEVQRRVDRQMGEPREVVCQATQWDRLIRTGEVALTQLQAN